MFRCRATEDNKVEYVSSNISRFGYVVDEFVSGKISLFEIIHEDDSERFTNKVKEHIRKSTRNFEFELNVWCRNGQDIRKLMSI